MSDLKKAIKISDEIIKSVTEKLDLHISSNGDGLVQIVNGMEVEFGWTDSEAIVISPIEYNGNTYDQVNFWGDGTLEIQDTEGESLNWCEFDTEFLEKVLEAVNKI